ncbi:hypothetical protein LIER_25401 [Lithospermum erythrorhizon]|uniref:Uncharacterized protein n=1 Tax=Lithospermum erythrorhizon TaxID=34254 RepID=A0AAV3R8B4_LITER
MYARREVYSIADSKALSSEIISFSKKELEGIKLPHHDPLVIAPIIANFMVERMLIDTGSSTDIFYLSTFDKLRLPRSLIKPLHTPLTGFTGHTIHSVGEVTLDFTVEKGTKVSTIRVQFTVVDLEDSYYNGLIGHLILTVLHAIVSPIHRKMKFPTPGGIGEISGDQKNARVCYQTLVPLLNRQKEDQSRKQSKGNHIVVNTVRGKEEEDNSPKEKESEKKRKPHEEVEEVPFKDGKADKTF